VPLPASLKRVNRRVTNRLTRPYASRIPWHCVLKHKGRKTGAVYKTPLMAWRGESAVVVALTYGSDVDWLKNTRAAAESVMVMGGAKIRVGPPETIRRAQGYSLVPRSVGVLLAALDVDEFVAFPIL